MQRLRISKSKPSSETCLSGRPISQAVMFPSTYSLVGAAFWWLCTFIVNTFDRLRYSWLHLPILGRNEHISKHWTTSPRSPYLALAPPIPDPQWCPSYRWLYSATMRPVAKLIRTYLRRTVFSWIQAHWRLWIGSAKETLFSIFGLYVVPIG